MDTKGGVESQDEGNRWVTQGSTAGTNWKYFWNNSSEMHREQVSGSFLVQGSTGNGGEVCSFVVLSDCWIADWWQVQVISIQVSVIFVLWM